MNIVVCLLLTLGLVVVGSVIPRGIINPHYIEYKPDKLEASKEKALANAKGVVLTYGK